MRRRLYAGAKPSRPFIIRASITGVFGLLAIISLAHAQPESVTRFVTKANTSSRNWLTRQLDAVEQAFDDFNQKLAEAVYVDEQNELLRKRVATLESESIELREQAHMCKEQARSEQLKSKSVVEGGLPTARTIASLHLSDDTLLSRPPKAVFEEATKAFAAGDYETSGRALAALVDHGKSDEFRTARSYYLAGVSLYHVGNFKRALVYLSRADAAATGEDEAYAPRALAWRALCHKRLGDERAEHETIRELIHRYPKSQEARRLNRNA